MEPADIPQGRLYSDWLRLLGEAGFTAEVRLFRLPGFDRPYELLVGVLA